MELSISLYEFVSILVAGAAMLISFVVASLLTFRSGVAHSSGERWARTFLSLLLVLGSLTIFRQILDALDLPDAWLNLDFAPLLYTFWLGPLIYLYIVARLNPSFRLHWWHFPHFVLPLLQAGFYFYAGFQNYANKERIWLNFYRYVSQPEDYIFYVSFALYLFAAYIHVRSAATKQADEVSLWLRHFINVSIILISIVVLFDFVSTYVWRSHGIGLYYYDWFEEPETILYSIILFWIAFNGYQAHRMTRQQEPLKFRKERYNLAHEEVKRLSESLDTLMETRKPYLNPDLSLALLAEQLEIAPKELSFVINESKQKSFNDYVNSWRVEETKRLLSQAEKKELGLLDIAFDAGFNSKATFNRVFKQLTGTTPSEYRRGQLS